MACAHPNASEEKPRITATRPGLVTGSAKPQWITIVGAGFADDFTVRLRDGSVDAHIDDRRRLHFVSEEEVKVKATFGSAAATWNAQVLSETGSPSNVFAFEVVAPEPQIEVVHPVERVADDDGFTLTVYGHTFTSYSVIRWNGEDVATTPISTSDRPSALTTGLKARIPASAVVESGRDVVHVYTRGPGGGLSAPKALFTNPRPFYDTVWFSLLILAVLASAGASAHWWRLKNMRERELKQEVQQRTAELEREKERTEAQAERLMEIDEAKNRLFAHLSHELRTPLTMIAAPVRQLLAEKSEALPPEAGPALEGVLRNADRLERRIDQLMNLARLEAGRLEIEPRPDDLAALAREATRAFAPLAEQRGLRLRFRAEEERLPARFDPERLRTVLDNLLSNALKFTPEGGKVVVRAVRTAGAPGGAGEQALVRVSDTGPGISQDELPHIFDRFHQANDPATLRHGGTGLGLALAKELAEMHPGGALRVESTLGVGTTFILALPVPDLANIPLEERENRTEGPVPANGSPAEPPLPPPEDPRFTPGGDGKAAEEARPVLLVVEDNRDVRDFLEQHLSKTYQVETASGGAEALDQAQARRPALVLSDVMMPGMSGTELCRRLKADDELGDVPVLLLTARADEDAEVEGLDAGADAYVEKPFSLEILHARIEGLIAGRNALRERYTDQLVVEPTGITVTSEAEAFYEEARAVVEDHIGDRAFDVGMFASEVGPGVQSKRQLRRKLKEATGRTPSVFIRQIRLERAAQLIVADPALRVYEVARAVGYRDAEYFSKRFREYHGVPPSRYAAASEEEAREEHEV